MSSRTEALSLDPKFDWTLLTIDESWRDRLPHWAAAKPVHLPVLLHSASERQQRPRLGCGPSSAAASSAISQPSASHQPAISQPSAGRSLPPLPPLSGVGWRGAQAQGLGCLRVFFLADQRGVLGVVVVVVRNLSDLHKGTWT